MTDPFDSSAVVPFAGLPAIPPPSAIDLDQVVLNMSPTLLRDARDSLIDRHFKDAGAHHAEILIERLIDSRRSPDLRPLDTSGAVRAYETATGQPAAPGQRIDDERRVLNQRLYTAALCNELARQANNYSSGAAIAREGSESSRSLQHMGLLPIPGLQPPEAVAQLADEMRAIARSLSEAEGLVCPPLQEYDWARGEEQRAEEAAGRLAVLIDKLAVLTALPQLDRSQVTGRRISDTSRVAAQIATVHAATTQSAVDAVLDDDRKRILSNLLPEVPLHGRPSNAGSPGRLPSALHRAADHYLLRLSNHPSVQEHSEDARNIALAEAARGIVRMHAQNPEAVRALPPVQAGLVRELVNVVEATPGLARQLRKSNLTLVRPHTNTGQPASPTTGRPRG